MIAMRVRQTVAKKDEMIQQLMERLESLGSASIDF
jgi:hypothetical protein